MARTKLHIADLPKKIALFPLKGALLLPRGHMPLNVFEPRYLALVDNALAGARYIGIIQPDAAHSSPSDPSHLFSIGCLGRLTQFVETDDGRYIVQLTGVCRFRVVEEDQQAYPYRQALVDYSAFVADCDSHSSDEAEVNREAVIEALRRYTALHSLEVDWKNVAEASNEALVNALSMMAPFSMAEKQALLEAQDLKTRADILVALTEIELARREHDEGRGLQ